MVTCKLTKHGKDMDKERMRKRLEEVTRNLRQSAIELQRAIEEAQSLTKKDIEAQKKQVTDAKARLEELTRTLSRMEADRWAAAQRPSASEAPVDRKFAQATTGAEAEGDPPAADIRAYQFNGKTKEEVLESGTLKEKVRLYLCYMDADRYFDNESTLTKKEVDRISKSIKTAEDKQAVAKYMSEYEDLCRYGEQLSYYFKRFQACLSGLAQLLNRWDSYDVIAELYTNEVRAIADSGLRDSVAKEKILDNMREKILYFLQRKMLWAELRWVPKIRAFKVGVYGIGQLYEFVQQEAKQTAEAMADFKALAVAAEEFISKSEIGYIPINIQMPIENAKEERFARYLVRNLDFFRSDYLIRKVNRERLSMIDHRRAVIPDYYETKPSRDLLKDARATLQLK